MATTATVSEAPRMNCARLIPYLDDSAGNLDSLSTHLAIARSSAKQAPTTRAIRTRMISHGHVSPRTDALPRLCLHETTPLQNTRRARRERKPRLPPCPGFQPHRPHTTARRPERSARTPPLTPRRPRSVRSKRTRAAWSSPHTSNQRRLQARTPRRSSIRVNLFQHDGSGRRKTMFASGDDTPQLVSTANSAVMTAELWFVITVGGLHRLAPARNS